jgi:hypothetical protein
MEVSPIVLKQLVGNRQTTDCGFDAVYFGDAPLRLAGALGETDCYNRLMIQPEWR